MSPRLPTTTTLPQWLRRRARLWPDAPALVDGLGGACYSHAALDHLVGRCAAGLAALGFGPGDVLLMLAANAPEWPIVALAALAAGGAVCGANPGCGTHQLRGQLHALKARHAFTTPDLLAPLRSATAAVGPVALIVLGEAEDTVSFTTLLACADAEPGARAGRDSLAWLGAEPASGCARQALRLTHGQVIEQILQLRLTQRLEADAVTMALQPMGQLAGFVQGALAPLAQGAAVVTLPSFEPERVAQAQARHRVTHLLLDPSA